MRATLKILAWTLGALIALPVLVAAFVFAAANTDWGRRLAEHAVAGLSGGRVAISGIRGHFPDDLGVARLELLDRGAAWFIADDVTVQWSPSRLVHKHLQIQLARAGRVQLLRQPPSAPGRQDGSNELPGPVDLDRLEVARLDIAEPIAGAPMSVTFRGSAHAASLQQAEVALSAARVDAPGTYEFTGRIDASVLKADLAVDEPEHGLIAGLAGMSDLGALSARVSIDGPREREATRFSLSAGALRAEGQGVLNFVERAIDVDVTASAPAMAPRADLKWKSGSLQAHVHGPFDGPDANGKLRIDELVVGDGRVRSVQADLEGNRGVVVLRAVLERLRVPGPKPALFEAAPVEVRADVRLDDLARPVTFAVSHPVLSLQGNANTRGDVRGSATVTAPSLSPLAGLAGIDLRGRTTLDVQVAMQDKAIELQLAGPVVVTGGEAPLHALLGNAAKIDIAATIQGEDIVIKRAQIDGRTVRISAQGSRRRETIDADWKIALSDLAILAPDVSGRIEAQGRLHGALDDLNLAADATGEMATHGFAPGPIRASVGLSGLPASPAGKIDATATLDGAPLQLALAVERTRDGALRGTIQHANWKSAHAEGELTLRKGDRQPQGRIDVSIGALDDLRPWIAEPVEGAATGSATFASASGRAQTRLSVDAHALSVQGSRIEHLTLTGTVDDPTAKPVAAVQIVADGIASNDVTGHVRLEANGPQNALKLKLTSALHHASQGDVPLEATATLDASARQIAIASLQAQYRGQPVQLLAPVRISFRDGVAMDRLRIGMQQAVLEVAGRISPALDATASVRNVTPALAKTFDVDVQADGTLTADARLTGTLREPRGSVKLAASGLRMRTGSARSLPPASVAASADLEAESARVEATVSAGTRVHLEASGRVPFSASGPVDVRARGTVDATVLNPILEVNGRRVKGKATLDVAASGTFSAPRIDGTLRLADGEVQDYALGAQLTKIEAVLEASGDTVRITALTAQAGPGTVSATGSIGVFASGRPVDVKITANNARPLATDLLTADMDANVTLSGTAETKLHASGSVTVRRADIKIPKALPPTVAVLDVRRPGQKEPPPPPTPPGPVIGLDLKIDAPRAVFVRGRGLDAEMGGELRVTGTTTSPQISGGFDMRRGLFDLGGASLNFTTGKVSFTGTGLTQKIDPTLDFQAQSTANEVTATLSVTGYADAPRIALTSTPELPQDEILARLLFGTSVKQLSPLQLAQIAAAVATITGVAGDNSPLNAIQKSLGLDRLSAGSTPTGGTTIEAGRYVADRVYVGAKQNTQGGTQAQVQVDLTKNLKLQATLGMGGTVPVQGTTPDNDPGSSVGLSYQFEY
jgi:translocation and assembly module TamB